jgi:DNA-binding ferritin-like protein
MRETTVPADRQVSGPTSREMHELFDARGELIDQITERIMQLGRVRIAMEADAA